MESEASQWQPFSRRGWSIQFDYPDPTPQGFAIRRDETPFRANERVHLSSPESQELYFEVVRFRELAPEDEYTSHKPYLEQWFGTDSVTALTETSLHGRPVLTYAFRWDGGERSVLLLQEGGDTYRVIYDPRSPLNADVLATLATRLRAR